MVKASIDAYIICFPFLTGSSVDIVLRCSSQLQTAPSMVVLCVTLDQWIGVSKFCKRDTMQNMYPLTAFLEYISCSYQLQMLSGLHKQTKP